MKRLLLILLCLPLIGFGQSLYNPQQLYDSPTGFFDEDSVRSIHLNFYNPNYHSYLVNAWYYNPDERIPATLTLNGTSGFSSVKPSDIWKGTGLGASVKS